MKKTEDKGNPSQPPKKRKFSVTALQKEMNRWSRLKIVDLSCYKLLRLYIGLPEFLDEYGVYPMNELYHIAVKINNKQSTKLLLLLEQSGSFRFIVDTRTGECLGFFSPATLVLDDLDRYEPNNREFLQYFVVNLGAVQKFTSMQKFTTPGNKYYILDKITTTSLLNNPPTEDCLTAGRDENRWSLWLMKSAAQPNKPKADYGNASDFFGQLVQAENTHSDYLEPQRTLLKRRYNLSQAEAGLVVTYFIAHYLVPHFDAQAGFRSTTFAGRCAWLQNYLKRAHIEEQVDTSYRACLDTIAARRRQQVEQQRQTQHDNHPLSAYEWTNGQTGQRYYRDPDDGVIDLPAEAPARPSATARWNPYTRQWSDEGAPAPTAALPEMQEALPELEEVFAEETASPELEDIFAEETASPELEEVFPTDTESGKEGER